MTNHLFRIFFIFCFFTFSGNLLAQNENLKSPKEYFAHYGKQHSFHHEILEYCKYLSEKSPSVKIQQYGNSYQGRPLTVVMVSSPSNISNLENIRKTNLHNIGLGEKPKELIEKTIVWASFSAHGNEAGATESSINILYNLITNPDCKSWLENTVVILDPCVNPDGYDRYVHFLRSVSGDLIHPEYQDREHMEPWPSGRYNHYVYDLNRDWAWQTQQESKQRIALYNQWMPHVHPDFHEMGTNANYYFAPAAEPLHKYLTPFQRNFQIEIGKNHASYFDQKGWLYWTRERFDLFYPSYGDTYPSYSGAIGMTYEMAGNSSSGRAIQINNGDTLTIQDKIDQNTVTGLSTVEISSKNAKKLIDNFKQYHDQATNNPKGKYKSYLLKKKPSMSRLTELLDRLLIKYAYVEKNQKVTGYHYQTKATQTADASEGDLVIHANQPRSTMLQILFEEEPELQDSITYDITAWSLPLAYGIDCYAFSSQLKIGEKSSTIMTKTHIPPNNIYAFQVPYNDLKSAQFLSKLYQEGYKARICIKESSVQGNKIERGTMVINRADNKHKNSFAADITKILTELKIEDFKYLSTGFSDNGGDIGGGSFELLTAPKVLTFSGEGVNPNSFGEVWHFFDKTLGYKLSKVDWNRFDRIDLKDFNTIILPNGFYSIDESKQNRLNDWVSAGGRLILIGGAVSRFMDKKGISLDSYSTEDEKKEEENKEKKLVLENRLNDYEGAERRGLSNITAGAIIKNTVDPTHPLAFGLGKTYYSLKTSTSSVKLQKGKWNVLYVPKSYNSYGFIGSNFKKKLEDSATLVSQNHGRGQAIFMVDNPLFRSFWDQGLLLFSNAVFINIPTENNY